MTLLLNNQEVERALTPEDAIAATESIYRELAEGKAINRPRSQTYMPVESKEHPGFRYRMKTQEGSGASSGVWALRITSDMAGFSYTAGVKRRRILPVATGNRYCGMVILLVLPNARIFVGTSTIRFVPLSSDPVHSRRSDGVTSSEESHTNQSSVRTNAKRSSRLSQ